MCYHIRMIKKNDILEVNILNLGCNGEGVAKHDDIVLFVPFALPGEKVKVQVINTKQKAYICKVIDIITPSPDRVNPVCPVFEKCGGCQLQHLNYNSACDFKTELVQNAITHIGKIDYKVKPCIESNKKYFYRNKLALPIDPVSRSVGMFRTASHSIVNINNCFIQKEWCSDIIDNFNSYLKNSGVSIYDENTGKGVLKHLVVREVCNKFLITVVVNGNELPNSESLISLLSKNKIDFGLNININKGNSNVILTNEYKHVYGIKEVNLEEYGIRYNINNASFMQVNDYIKHLIYDAVLQEIDINAIVVDSYSGAGLLTAIMSRVCKYAYGIEIVKPAVDIANELKKNNNILNMKNICGDAAVELPKLINTIADDFVVVIDPPRKGCSKQVIDTLGKVQPKKIIYISCNPSTLARDLYNLNQVSDRYVIKTIQPYDMFPQTKHVETLVVLERK